jgi:hypothetical protein
MNDQLLRNQRLFDPDGISIRQERMDDPIDEYVIVKGEPSIFQ